MLRNLLDPVAPLRDTAAAEHVLARSYARSGSDVQLERVCIGSTDGNQSFQKPNIPMSNVKSITYILQAFTYSFYTDFLYISRHVPFTEQ